MTLEVEIISSPLEVTITEDGLEVNIVSTPLEVTISEAGPQGIPGPGVPPGGTDGQLLEKVGTTNYVTRWATRVTGVSSVFGRTGDVIAMTGDYNITQISGAATVAITGSYNDLLDKPFIPTRTSDLINDSGFITAAQAPVQSVAGRTGDIVLTTADIGGLAPVAITNSYLDLYDLPNFGSAAFEDITYFAQVALNLSDIADPDLARANISAVGLNGDEVINGLKTFTTLPECANFPTNGDQLVNRDWVLSVVTIGGITEAQANLLYLRLDSSNGMEGTLNLLSNTVLMNNIGTPAAAPSGSLFMYAKDNAGVIQLASVDASGNEIIYGSGSGGGDVTSVFGRTGAVIQMTNDYTWAQIDKTVSDLADLTTKSHFSLTDIGTYTHAQIDTHINDFNNPHHVTTAQIGAVDLTTNQSISGIKTFLSFPLLPNTPLTDPLQAVTKVYVDTLVTSGARLVAAAITATTAALPTNVYFNGPSNNGVSATITASVNGALPLVGAVALTPGQLFLVKDEPSPNGFKNGLYQLVSNGSSTTKWSGIRAVIYDTSGEIVEGTFFNILQGANANQQWRLTTTGSVTVGTTQLTYVQSSQIAAYTVNNGLTALANNFQLGGALIQNTVISNGIFNLTINLDATGNFGVQDAGVYVFQVDNTGFTRVGTAATNLAQLAVQPVTATTKGIVIRAAAAQTASLTEWQTSAGVISGSITSDGRVNFAPTNVNSTSTLATFSLSPATVIQEASTGADYTVSTLWWGYKFTTGVSASQINTLIGYFRRDAVGTFTNSTATITARLYDDNAGVPGTALGSSQAIRLGNVASTAYAAFQFALGTQTLTATTTYWITFHISALPQGSTLYHSAIASGTAKVATSANGTAWSTVDGFSLRFALQGVTGTALAVTSPNGVAATFNSVNTTAITATSVNGVGISASSTNGTGISATTTFGTGITATSTNGNAIVGTTTAGIGLSGTTTTGTAISGTSTSGTGIIATTTTGTALSATTTDGIGAIITANPSTNTSAHELLRLTRNTSAVAGNGIGAAINVFLETSTGASTQSSAVQFRYTTATTGATLTSDIGFFTRLNNVLAERMTLSGAGQLTATNFVSTVATGTAPFTVASTTKVTNLNADLLDSQDGTFYLARANQTGTQGITTITMNTARLLGRSTAAAGVVEEISIGTGLSLSGGVLSNTNTSAVWGSITGTLSAQTDLQAALNAKYDASNPSGYISANQSISLSGDATGTGTTSIAVVLAASGVTAGTYGSASNVPVFAVDAKGRVTGVTNTAISITASQVSDFTTAAGVVADARILLQKGVALGLATLDSGGKIPLSQIPASLIGALNYQGTWNASTNSPTLASSTGTKGYYYLVSVAGTTNLNGITDWQIGDWAVFDGSVWEKIDNTDGITSVNGMTGPTVTLTTTNIAEGTNLYYTDARARAAVSITTSTGLSYNSSTGVFAGINASTTVKGVASFNSTNFTVTSGAVNTVQNIDTAANVQFATLYTSSTATVVGTLEIGGYLYTNGTFQLQADSGYYGYGGSTSANYAHEFYVGYVWSQAGFVTDGYIYSNNYTSFGDINFTAGSGYIGYGGASTESYNHEFYGNAYFTSSVVTSGTFNGDGSGITNIVGGNIQTNSVGDAQLRQSSGLSVIGRSANTAGNVADITAAADGAVLRRSGTTLGFGAIALGSSNAVSGQLALANGGLNANLTANVGGIFYSTATAGAILAGTVTARQMLQSGTSAAPAWSTTTWPATTGVNTILYSSAANVIGTIAAVNSGVLVTSGAGVPSIATDIPTAVTIGTAYIYRVGGTDVAVTDGGTGLSVGVSGGIPYFSTTTAMASSTLLGANQVVLGGGAGTSPSTSANLTFSGTALTLTGYVAGTYTVSAINQTGLNAANFSLALSGNDTTTSLTNYGCRISATDTGTFNPSSSGQIELLYGQQITASHTGSSGTGSPHTKDVRGQDITVTNTGTVTSGSGVRSSYGQKITVTGDTNGTSTTYGIYVDVSGASTNWAAYFNTGSVRLLNSMSLGTTGAGGAGNLLINGTGKTAIVLDSAGANYGTIASPTSTAFSLGYSSGNGVSLGTSVLAWTTGGRVGILTTSPSFDLSFAYASSRTISLEESTGTTGGYLAMKGGNAKTGTSNSDGGGVSLQTGTSTGSGGATIDWYTTPRGSAGTGTNTAIARWNMSYNGNLKPLTNNSYDIGEASTNIVRAVYCFDINASGTVTAPNGAFATSLIIPNAGETNPGITIDGQISIGWGTGSWFIGFQANGTRYLINNNGVF